MDHLHRKKLCPCSFSDVSIEQILLAMKNKSSTSECEACDRVFSSRQYLLQHLRTCTRAVFLETVRRQQLTDEISAYQEQIEQQKAKIIELEQRVLDGKLHRRKRPQLNAALRMTLWNETFGEKNGTGQCYCCNREITQQVFEAGHVIAVANGGSDHISNLKVVCKKCNLSMGKTNMLDFRMKYFSR